MFSDDSGENFDKPITISNINPVGRVGIAMIDKDNIVVSWVETIEEGGALKFVKVNKSGKIGESIAV
ncbi:MAG: hypothetical protein HRT66_12385 [Flavobacteriaceae bacterium]|nr:hypothetical protein [Flavobacteriaceae bacterium]